MPVDNHFHAHSHPSNIWACGSELHAVSEHQDPRLKGIKWYYEYLHDFGCEVSILGTVTLGNKELFDKEQIGIKEPFPVTNLPFTS